MKNDQTNGRPSLPEPRQLQKLCDIYKGMGDYTRVHILWILMEKEASAGELAKELRLTKSAVSYQLRKLHTAGLITSRHTGKNISYSLADGSIRQLLRLAEALSKRK